MLRTLKKNKYITTFTIVVVFSAILVSSLVSANIFTDAEDHVIGQTLSSPDKEVDFKLLFNQLFALEIRKELPFPGRASKRREINKKYEAILKAFTYYTPKTFNESIDEMLELNSSSDAYNKRDEIFGAKHNRNLIKRADLYKAISFKARRIRKVRDFIDKILDNRFNHIPADENFLNTPEGQNIIDGITYDGKNVDPKGVIFLMVPGYASHAIKDYIFEELVIDFNRYYGREDTRPLIHQDGLDFQFEPHTTYYADKNGKEKLFDVLHPSGNELGNTTGANLETTNLLKNWIETLPEEYDDKKIIILGYSKGAPIVLDIPAKHTSLRDRIIGFVSYAGVIQGTNVARSIIDSASEILKSKNIDELIDKLLIQDPDSLISAIIPIFGYLDIMLFKLPVLKNVFKIFGYDLGDLPEQAKKFLQGREITEILAGANDLTPLKCTKWNLKNFNNDVYTKPTFLFNLSAVTDIRTFSRPFGINEDGSKVQSLLAPTIKDDGILDWKNFSLDATFLYFSSIGGFKTAPGGLFDTQVDLANSKSMTLDKRALSESLTAKEIDSLWTDPELFNIFNKNGITSKNMLSNTPRNELILKENTSNITSIDLGEIKCHHWCTFKQALKPPTSITTETAEWPFPRRAYMRALLETMALYNIINNSTTRGGR